jgi:hypothetical protein
MTYALESRRTKPGPRIKYLIDNGAGRPIDATASCRPTSGSPGTQRRQEAQFRTLQADLDRHTAALFCCDGDSPARIIEQLCHQAGLGDEPRRVLEELRKLQVVDVVMPTREGVEIRRRCIAQPTEHQAILLQRLGLTLPSSLEITDES